MAVAYKVGTGSTVTFGTQTGFGPLITGISTSGPSRPSLQTSHLATSGYHTFVPGELIDGGTVTLNIWFEGGVEAAGATVASVPAFLAAEVITIHLGASGGDTIAFSGFVESFDWDVPLEDGITGTVTFKVAGAITYAEVA